MNQIKEIFLSLLRSEICGSPMEPQIREQITPAMLEQLLVISRNQDLIHILAVALKKQKLLTDEKTAAVFQQCLYHVLVRHEAMEYEKNRIFQLFETEQIAFVPLKGAVIRKYYPDAWMRTSCDIDILVREQDLERAKNALVSACGYRIQSSKYHDITMYSPGGLLLELHFSILENMETIDRYLERVWEYVRPAEPDSFRYEMTSEYLLFHVFAHMLYHFVSGGCGVKFITDIWILEHVLTIDEAVFRTMCETCGIGTFVEKVRKLAAVWYGDEQHDSVTSRMEQYIWEGGVFGSVQTEVTARKTKVPGNWRYIVQRVFVPYKEFCASYPRLEKYPLLYPYYTVKRWCKISDKYKVRTAWQELKISMDMQPETVDELKQLFKDLEV